MVAAGLFLVIFGAVLWVGLAVAAHRFYFSLLTTILSDRTDLLNRIKSHEPEPRPASRQVPRAIGSAYLREADIERGIGVPQQ